MPVPPEKRGGITIQIEQGSPFPLLIEISPKKGVRISSTERPPLPKQVENSAIVKFRQAYVGAATALFEENLPGPDDDRSAVVDDKLHLLDQATWRLLNRFGWGGKKQVRIQVAITEKDLAPQARLVNVTPLALERCQELLAAEIEGSVKRFQEEKWKRIRVRQKSSNGKYSNTRVI